jgi:signal transduction histidine kinase
MKAHPMVGDSLLAAGFALFDLLIFTVTSISHAHADTPAPKPWYLAIPLIIGAVLPVPFRRRFPVVSAYLVLLLGIPHAAFELGIASLAAQCVAVYTLVVYVNRRQTLFYVLANLAVAAVQLPMQTDSQAELIIGALVGIASLTCCWLLGEFVGARHAYQGEVEARLHMLETERDQQAKIAVAAERARIARELHDVVAHAVSVMVVQADGAALTVATQPDLAERAVKTISATGREALTELRRLLGVLRSEQTDEERTPQPGTESLAELAERVRAVGLPVRLEIDGAIDDLPTGVGLGIYRIVQEALTNSLKHAGPGASALVRLERTADRVYLSVADDGLKGRSALVGLSGGNGLIGMRERAHMFGGTLLAGPQPGGGWRVQAVLPFGGA